MSHVFKEIHDFWASKNLDKKLKKIPSQVIFKSKLYCAIFDFDPSETCIRQKAKVAADIDITLFRSRSSFYAGILEPKADRLVLATSQIYHLARPTGISLNPNGIIMTKLSLPNDMVDELDDFPSYVNITAILRRMGNVGQGNRLNWYRVNNYPNFRVPHNKVRFYKVLARRMPKLKEAIKLLEDVVNESTL